MKIVKIQRRPRVEASVSGSRLVTGKPSARRHRHPGPAVFNTSTVIKWEVCSALATRAIFLTENTEVRETLTSSSRSLSVLPPLPSLFYLRLAAKEIPEYRVLGCKNVSAVRFCKETRRSGLEIEGKRKAQWT
ncbi:hypothetical protein E2C01_023416 [Portunus trituberculatus]|uniref:Uncharacterized protein n=1 Tax=Portunus trituberculatus TaxID=210409 RepID=A0A5B7E8R8_PORTR|nr:hypothetical protein [Portunus trituberculatus]